MEKAINALYPGEKKERNQVLDLQGTTVGGKNVGKR